MTLKELQQLRESEDKVEFKEASKNFPWNGGSHSDPKERRKCLLGYVVALANEGGGRVVFGMADKHPHKVVGSQFLKNEMGEMEDAIYEKLSIRVHIEELFDSNGKRVVVVSIPSRSVGRILKFEGVALMRTGDSLRNMSDDETFKILSETEPDFSSKICPNLKTEDLDVEAIQNLKEAYSRKQRNPQFLTLSNEQSLSDLGLLVNEKLNYASLILVGSKESIQKYLPQTKFNLEYRKSSTQINFDQRIEIDEPFFKSIDMLWEAIDVRNGSIPVQQGAFIFDIPYFNREVIREALNNAIAHRDYTKSSEVNIKQFDNELHIISPGGFPLGVTVENLLTVSSTPRNRLLSDVLAKTGIVERSGQGVDKIYYQTLSEAKPAPDYSHSDNFQVELRLSASVEDKGFALFIRSIQSSRGEEDRLGVQEVIGLNEVRKGFKVDMNMPVFQKLENEGLIERVGKTRSQRYILSKEYFQFTGKESEYSQKKNFSEFQLNLIVINHIQEFGRAKVGELEELLKSYQSRDQVKYLVKKLVDSGALEQKGTGKGTYYVQGGQMNESIKLFERVIQLGVEEMQKRGELPNE